MPNHESITRKIAQDLQNGVKLMVTDADKYGSSQTAFPRRIKDTKKLGIDYKITKIKLPAQNGTLVTYSQYSI
jgi:hypothetical protein